MSGICGICEPGRRLADRPLGFMLKGLSIADEIHAKLAADIGCVFGASQRLATQDLGAVPGIRVALDADLINLAEIHGIIRDRGVDPGECSAADCVAHLYRHEGIAFVRKLRGAFAAAVWDDAGQRLLLAVDRFGLRGLCWAQDRESLLFASRPAAIRAALRRPVDPDPAAIMQFLLFSVVPAPLTAYRGIQKLPPGSLLIFQDGRANLSSYWDMDYRESPDRDEEHWSERVRDGIRTAVHRHLVGLQPTQTGAYLSGGTDSSSVTAFLSEFFNPARTFSIYFSEGRYSEANYARIAAARFKTQHFERCLTPQDAAEAIPLLIQYYDEPFGNSSALGSLYCARLAREVGVSTLLAGDGGDELFAGNQRYASDRPFAFYSHLPTWLRRGVIEPLSRLFPLNGTPLSLPRRYVRRAQIPNPRRIFSYDLFFNLPPEEAFSRDFLRQAPPEEWMAIADGHYRRPSGTGELNRLMYLDLKLILADNDLRKVNGTAELAGVRVRYPMLDDQLAELSAQIPARLKLKGSQKRYIFKRAMEGILPPEILQKKKHGFGVPLGVWFLSDQRLNSLMNDVLGDSRTLQRGYFQPDFYRRIREWHQQGSAPYYGEVVWYLLALELWHRQHVDRVPESVHVE
jgi:asparagine synthase (glutamine-hydrolysing)